MSSPRPTSEASSPVPCSLEEIVSSGNLERWPVPPTSRILVVESDPWMRMLFCDALRESGLEDIAPEESGAEALAGNDPSTFGLIIVGLEGENEEALDFCRRALETAPRIPILAVTDRSESEIRQSIGSMPFFGVLTGPFQGAELRRAVEAVLRTPAEPVEVAGPAPETTAEAASDEKPLDVFLLGAQETDVSVLRLLYRVQRINLRMVFDPNPEAFGLSLAQNLGIPTISGDLAMELDRPPDVVVLARSDLESHLASLNLENAAHVTRDELEIFLVDPEAFLNPDAPPSPADPPGSGPSSETIEPSAQEPVEELTVDHGATDSGSEAASEESGDRWSAPASEESSDSWNTPSSEESSDSWNATASEESSDSWSVPAEEDSGVRWIDPPDEDETEKPEEAATPSAETTDEATDPESDAATDEPGDEPPVSEDSEKSPDPGAFSGDIFQELASGESGRSESEIRWRAMADTQEIAFSMPSDESFRPDSSEEIISLFDTSLAESDQEPEAPLTGEIGSLLGALDLLLDFERLSNRVLEIALDMCKGSSGSLMLLQEDRRELRIVSSIGLSDLVVQKTRQRVGEGIAGRVAASGEPLLLLGTIGDERFKIKKERADIRSSICVPVCAEGRIIGIINTNSDPESDPFGRQALRRVAHLGDQVGSALDRSLQLRRMRGRSFQLSVRAEIEQIAASPDDMVSRLRRITDRIVQMLSVDTCGIYMLDRKREELRLRAVAGVSVVAMDAVSVPVGTGSVGWVAKNLSPLVLRSSYDEETGASQQTLVNMPIRYHTELIGVLAIESTSEVPIDEDRLDLIASVASVVGQQIGESQAQEDSERKVTMLSALSELGVAFTAAPERENLAKLVTFSASTVLESDVSTIRMLREEASFGNHEMESFELLAAHGAALTGNRDPLTDLEERVARAVLAARKPCRDLDLPLAEVEPLMQRSNVFSLLGFPLLNGDQLLGVITVYRVNDAKGKPVGFRDEEIEIATRLSDYAAAAASRFVGERDDEPPEDDG